MKTFVHYLKVIVIFHLIFVLFLLCFTIPFLPFVTYLVLRDYFHASETWACITCIGMMPMCFVGPTLFCKGKDDAGTQDTVQPGQAV